MHWDRDRSLPDGLHPDEQSGELVVDILSACICDALKRVDREHLDFWPSTLPPIWMTNDTFARWGQAPTDNNRKAISDIDTDGPATWARRNASGRATDELTLLSGGSLLACQALVLWAGTLERNALAVPATTPLIGS